MKNTMKNTRIWKAVMFVGCQTMLFGLGGSCLPDNFLADAAGEVVNGLIVDQLSTIIAGSGLL